MNRTRNARTGHPLGYWKSAGIWRDRTISTLFRDSTNSKVAPIEHSDDCRRCSGGRAEQRLVSSTITRPELRSTQRRRWRRSVGWPEVISTLSERCLSAALEGHFLVRGLGDEPLRQFLPRSSFSLTRTQCPWMATIASV